MSIINDFVNSVVQMNFIDKALVFLAMFMVLILMFGFLVILRSGK